MKALIRQSGSSQRGHFLIFHLSLFTYTKKLYFQDPTSPSRQVASRIRQLPKGTIGTVKVHQEKYIGTIDREASGHSSSPGRLDSLFESGFVFSSFLFVTTSHSSRQDNYFHISP